jgi:hypothetical protein
VTEARDGLREHVSALYRRPWVTAVTLAILFALLLYLRRGDTLTNPSIWDEEGTIVPDIFHSGLLVLIHPVSGYLLVVPKLIDLIAFAISATQFPLITTILAWLFSIGVGLVVAFAPTVLRHRPLAALAIFLIPTDPEIFGTSLYLLWWCGILLLLVALWSPEDSRVGSRLAILVVAGLSSPVAVIVVPVLVVRALIFRRRSEIVTGVAGVVIAGIQGAMLLTVKDGVRSPTNGVAPLRNFFLMVGDYLVHSWNTSDHVRLAAAAALLVVLLAGSLLVQGPRWPALVLGYLFLVGVANSLIRVGTTPLDPLHNGPRYFFFGFLGLSWFLLWLVTRWRWRWLVVVPMSCLIIATIGVIPGWSRSSVDLHWSERIVACSRGSGLVTINAVQADGNLPPWYMKLTASECAAWVARDPFAGRDR